MYFDHVKSLEELKAEYRRLAMMYHPDRGGSTEQMQDINAAYDNAFRRLAARAQTDQASAETPEEFRAIINALIRLDGLSVELCGSWLWIGGNTYKHKDALKAAGCRFSGSKKLWYWRHADESAPHSRGTSSMTEIRQKYGSQRFAGGHGIKYCAELNA